MRSGMTRDLGVCLLAATCACAGAPVASSATPGPPELPPLAVIVLKPAIRFQQVQDESEMAVPPEARAAFEVKLLGAAVRAVEGSGQAMASLPADAETAATLAPLVAAGPRLARGLPRDDALAAMRRLAAASRDSAVLAHSLEASVGSGGTWNPYSGAITSSMSRTVIRAALVRCSSGEVLWSQQVQLRDLPSVASTGLDETLTALYASFPRKAVKAP